MKYVIHLVLCFISIQSIGQNSIILTNADPIDPYRYEGIKGSPYLFDDFTIGEIIDKNGDVYNDVTLNYNAYAQEVEVRKGDQFIELEPGFFKSFQISDSKALKKLGFTNLSKLPFQYKPHPQLDNAYYMELYNSEFVKAYVMIRKTVYTTIERPPGKLIEKNKFRSEKQLIVIDKNELLKTSMKKKSIIKALQKFGDINQFAKKRKLKVDRFETIALFFNDMLSSS